MSAIKQLQEALLAELDPEMRKHGYDRPARGSTFYRKMPFGRLAFSISFIKHRADVDLTLHMALRFDDLEDLVNEYNDYLSRTEKKTTFSLGAELGNVSEGRQKRWTIAAIADAGPIAESIIDAFIHIGRPFLARLSNMEIAFEILSKDDDEACLLSPIHDARARRALGLAFLLGDRERFSKLATAKTEFLESRNDFGLQSFLRLRDALEHKFDEPLSR